MQIQDTALHGTVYIAPRGAQIEPEEAARMVQHIGDHLLTDDREFIKDEGGLIVVNFSRSSC